MWSRSRPASTSTRYSASVLRNNSWILMSRWLLFSIHVWKKFQSALIIITWLDVKHQCFSTVAALFTCSLCYEYCWSDCIYIFMFSLLPKSLFWVLVILIIKYSYFNISTYYLWNTWYLFFCYKLYSSISILIPWALDVQCSFNGYFYIVSTWQFFFGLDQDNWLGLCIPI